MSLLDAAERFAAMDRSAVELDTARCLHVQDRHSGCEACYSICPEDAITPGKPPVLDAAKCGSCLACLTVCPTGAYSADDAVAALLRSAAHVEGSSLELVCGQNPLPEKGTAEDSTGIRVKGCLAGLGTGTYLALAALGLEHVVVRREVCAECKWASLQPEIEKQTQQAVQFLAGWGKMGFIVHASPADAVIERPVWNAENPPLSRRELFRMMAHQGQVAMARAMENGERPTGRHPGRDHFRISQAVSHMAVPQDESLVAAGELRFATVKVTDACTACGTCARACPTDALRFEMADEDTHFKLQFLPRNCIACGLCTRVCIPVAVEINEKSRFRRGLWPGTGYSSRGRAGQVPALRRIDGGPERRPAVRSL